MNIFNSYVQIEWQNYPQIYEDVSRVEDGRRTSTFVIQSLSVKANQRIWGSSIVGACKLTAIYIAVKKSDNSSEQRVVILSFPSYKNSFFLLVKQNDE